MENTLNLNDRSDIDILNKIGKSIEVTDALVQWRSGQLNTFQIAHADGEKVSYNVIVPLTNGHTLSFHPGTHHVVTTKKEAEKNHNPKIAGKWVQVTLQEGELLLFHTT